MIDPKNVHTDANVVEVSFKLDDRQRGVLASQVSQEGFDIIQHLMVDVIRDFNLALMNTPVGDKDQIVAKHCIAKAAAQFYEGFMVRLRAELDLHTYNAARLGTPENPEAPAVTPDFQ